MRTAGWLAIAAAALAFGGCILVARGVALSYDPSKSIVKGPHKTPIEVVVFLDRRENRRWIGQTPMLMVFKEPLRARGDVAAWATKAMADELSAMGYKVVPQAEWKAGGAVEAVTCAGGKRISCTVKFELYVRMKDNWQVLKREYTGEGSMPPLFSDADLYELSLEEAMRDVLSSFRRDFELTVP